MKKLILGLAIFAAISFAPPVSKDTARVKQVSGLFIFIESAPVADYEVLGTVKKGGIVWNGKAAEMVTIMVRRARRDYPNAEGIVFDDITLDHATVIKFR